MKNVTFLSTYLLFFITSCAFNVWVHSQEIDHRVYLLGNTTDIGLESKFYDSFSNLMTPNDPFTVIINGDLIDSKITGGPTVQDSLKIDKLLRSIAKFDNGKAIIVPGDRDWADSGANGANSAEKLEKLIKGMKFKNVQWALRKGCPGPNLIPVNDHLILVSINTQWFNHPYDKPGSTSAECRISTERDFLIALENLVEDSEDRNILVTGHFPLKSLGEYGGNFPIEKYLSPPILGSFKVGFRQNIGTSKDISNERFKAIGESIENVIKRKGSVIYAAGHEKNLQVLRLGENFVVNSGSPTNAKYVARNKKSTGYAESIPGLVELVYYRNGQVDYQIHKFTNNAKFKLEKQEALFSSPCGAAIAGVHFNTVFNPCKTRVSDSQHVGPWAADTIAIAGDYSAGILTKLFLGKHYRTSWNAPVKVPYLDLKNRYNGLSIYEKGGGHQTTSLKIKGGDGKEYVFRSVDKDPGQLLPFALQGTVISRVLHDITSMQQPYGAMAIGTMLDATDILHVSPKLYMLPPSDDLGPFKNRYSNLLGMLEEKPVNVKNVKVPFAGADEILQSRKMFRELNRDHDNMVNAKEYAKARMFDILVGDWGKHEDNWKWAGYKKEHGMLYRPIPRDRDYVFSRWDGFITYFADRKWGLELGENFGYEINDIRSLTFSSQAADRRLLNGLTREDWQEAARYIQDHITDEIIESGIKSMPAEVYELSGREIENKLKQRVKDLDHYADRYYEQLMIGGVEVVGSNKREYFEITRKKDGSVHVAMFNTLKGENKKGERLYYDRTFYSHETKEIRLYGLAGKDVFNLTGNTERSIKIRIVGGPGSDVIRDASNVRFGGKSTLVYEKENNTLRELGGEAKEVDHWDSSLYYYDRHRFGFDSYFPIVSIKHNSSQGYGITAGVNFTQKNPLKQTYSSIHKIKGNLTTENINIFTYEGRFHHVLKKWDVLIGGLYADHNGFTDFFGIGNGVPIIEDLSANGFYVTQNDTYGLHAGIAKGFWNKSELSFAVGYEKNKTISGEGTILAPDNPTPPPGVFGFDDATLFDFTTTLDIDFRDRISLPEKGARFFLKHQSGLVLDNKNSGYGLSEGFFEQYATMKWRVPTTLWLRLGGSTTYGEETIPFYKLRYLGQNSGLRGFVNNRFTGKSTLYLNSELRLLLARFHTAIVPIKFGIRGFYDTGRVYSDFDVNSDWHQGYGFGIYLVPLTEDFTFSITAGFSEEESGLILFNIGSHLD